MRGERGGLGWRASLCGVVGLLGAWVGGAQASPWNRDPGQALTISRVGYYAAEAEGRRFEQTTSELYAEIGVTDRLMAGGKLNYAWQDTGSATGDRDRLSGLAEASLFAQVEIARWDGGALSLMASGTLPTETVSRVGTERAFSRDGQAGLAALVGVSEGAYFGAGRVGHDWSLGQDADFLRTEVAAGARLSPRSLLLVEAFDTRALGGAGLDGVDYDLTQVAPSLVLPIRRRMRLQIGATFDVAGRNVDQGAGGFVALWIGE